MKRAAQRLTAVGLTLLLLGVLAQAQDAASAQAGNATVPRMVKFSGTATNAQGKAINGIAGITFSIYKDQQGGAALWMETQNVNLDSTGRYSVLLGATRPEGLPMELFASGEARWVGVRVNGQAESARVVLLSVPYALKANDAETLGGLPASAFLRAAPPVIAASSSSDTSSSSSGSASLPIGATPTGSGLAGDIAIWTTSSNLGNSHMAEGASGLSVNEALNLPATGAATSVSGKNSQSLNLFGASFSSTLATSISQHFRLLAEPAGNNTTTPSGTLNLQYATGTGTPAETGISFTSGGIFKAKTVNATTLSGNGASVTNVNAAKLGGFLPSAFARLGVNDNFTGSVTAASFSTGGNVSGATGSFTGNVNVGGAEAVTGNLSSGGTVSGATGSFTGNLNVGGAASVTGNLTSGATISGVTGAFSGNLGVSGNGVFSGSVGIGVAPTALLTLSQANGSGTLTAATPLQSIANTHDASSSVALAEPFATWRVGVNRPPDNLTLLDAFYIYNQSTNSTKMAITFGGNVGIGTTNPSSLLSVAGPIESTSGGFKQPAGNTIAQEYWAVVNSDGSLAQGSGATASAVVTGFTGAYEVDFSTDVSACAYVATPSFGPAFIYVQPRFNNVKGVFVQTHNSSGSVANFGFHLVVHC